MAPRLLVFLFIAVLIGACSEAGSAEELASEGLALAREQRIPEALERFNNALESDPNNLLALYNGGLSELWLRKGSHAALRFERFVGLRPTDPLGHFNLARAYALSLRREEALDSLRRAVELGFDRHDELMGGGFESIEEDLRFAQIEVLVAQRAGVGFEEHSTGAGYGGQRMRSTKLPGQGERINRRCVGPTVPPLAAGADVDFEAGCHPR